MIIKEPTQAGGFEMETLVGTEPKDTLLLYGPTKLLLNNYHWHSPDVGIVASYTPTANDVKDHFDVFRGVDQVEAFTLATVVSLGVFLECRKKGRRPIDMKDDFVPAFISIGQVNFHNYLKLGETFISIGSIKFYKWRQMVCEGRIYKVPENINLDDYFSNYTEERLLKYDLSDDFKLVAELFDVTGRALKIEQFKKL